MGETFTIALAILHCHGIRVSDLPAIERKPKDVLILDYMGLKFKVDSENAKNVAHLIEPPLHEYDTTIHGIRIPGMFDKTYQFNGGTEYDSLPNYKIVETISNEFRNRVNRLIQPNPKRREFVKSHVLGSISGTTGSCPPKMVGSMRVSHEEFRAMNDELVSCKLLPYKRIEKTGKGIFGVKIVQDSRPSFHDKSFKIIKTLYNKEYSFSQNEDEHPYFIKYMSVSVTITPHGFVQFRVLHTIAQPYAFNEVGEVVVDRNQVITDLMQTFPECNLVTLFDLSCSACSDYDVDTERKNFRIPRANLSGSEPGEGGGKKSRSKKRGRKSVHRRNKSMHKKRK
jgi:putative lipoic acid-binding regulatory protein